MKILHFRAALAGAASLLVLTACGNTQVAPATNTEPPTEPAAAILLETPPAGQLPEGVTPTAYRLDLKTDPREIGFSGTVEIDLALDAPHSRIWLHSVDQDILLAKAVLEDGTEIPASFTGDQAPGGVSRLDFESPVPAGAATLVIDYTAIYNMGLAGLYKAMSGDTHYLASQMEAIDARRMLPSFDEPRFKTPWTLTLTAPQGMEVVTNAPELSATSDGDGWTTHAFATTRPIQSYLVALAVGPYDVREAPPIPASDKRGEPIPLRAFAAAGKAGKTETALDITDEMLLWQENYFDYPYPYGKLDLIAAPEYAYGAMENAGAIVYREAALLIDEQTSLARRRGIFTIHAHELGHQWFGNLVTPAWWNDIWLNEAFATWISYKTLNAVDPDGEWNLSPILAGLTAMPTDSLSTARQIRNPILSNGDILDAFDAITYRKGGSVLNMFETYLSEEKFREGIRLHMRRFEDGIADADDFMQSLADGSGEPGVVAAFTSYINQPGIPELDVQVTCPAIDAGLITITQKRYAPLGSTIDPDAQTWGVPFAARIGSANGDVVVRQMLTDKVSEIALDGGCADWVMPNAGGAGYWRFRTNEENLTALTATFDTLSAGEQIMFADALTSGFSSGHISPAALLTGLEATVSGHPRAVSQPLGVIGTLSGMLDEDEKQNLKAWVETTYGPLAEYLDSRPATALSQQEILLRDELNGLLLEHGQDTSRRAALLERASAYVGLEDDADPDAIPSSDLSAAMMVGIIDGERPFYDAALALVRASDNQTQRRAILTVMAQQGNDEIVADIMKTVQGDGFNSDELYAVMTSATENTRAKDTAWNIFKASFDNVLPRIPEIRKQQISTVAGDFCDADKAADAKAFFDGKASQIPGYERSLAQGMERAALCSALKAHVEQDVKAAFGK